MEDILTIKEYGQLTKLFKEVFERNKDKETHDTALRLVSACTGAIDNGYEEVSN